MTPHGKSPLRLVLFGIIAAWLAGDLFMFHGPLRQRIDLLNPNSAASIAKAKALGVVARVFGQPITRSQLDRAVSEKLWLEGKTAAPITTEQRTAALDELIDLEILRAKIKAEEKPPMVSPEEINERLRRFVGRFESKGALETAIKSQGIRSEDDLKKRLAAHIQQEKFIELHIGPQVTTTDEEAKKWFEENQKSIANPERVEARHIFIPTLDHPPEEAKQKLDDALAALTEKKKDFATIAKELSEDPATKDNGGALGWMTYDRLPADFAALLFSLELNKPTLIRSRLGWHLAEVTARKPAEPRTFEQAKPEILAATASVKHRQAIRDFRNSLRKTEEKNIRILQDIATE
ncbi:MAG: peptidylprolyl isomerase [Luteolibacter sp.]